MYFSHKLSNRSVLFNNISSFVPSFLILNLDVLTHFITDVGGYDEFGLERSSSVDTKHFYSDLGHNSSGNPKTRKRQHCILTLATFDWCLHLTFKCEFLEGFHKEVKVRGQ